MALTIVRAILRRIQYILPFGNYDWQKLWWLGIKSQKCGFRPHWAAKCWFDVHGTKLYGIIIKICSARRYTYLAA